jgi:hypothetical protein
MSVPVGVELAASVGVTLPERLTVTEGDTVSVLSELSGAGGTALEYAWFREVQGTRVALPGETFESLVLAFVQRGDAGRYGVTVRTASGRSEATAVVELEVREADPGTGGNAGGGQGGTSGGGSGLGQERWWVFEEVSAAGAGGANAGDGGDGGAGGAGENGLAMWWVYDRVQQQSAWVWRDESGGWKMGVWASEDQQVMQLQKGGSGAKAGVLSFDVEGSRPGERDVTVWDGFELTGETGADGVPEVLTGRYGAQGDGERRPITLRWNAAWTSGAAGFGDVQQVFEWLSRGAAGD